MFKHKDTVIQAHIHTQPHMHTNTDICTKAKRDIHTYRHS